MLLPVFLSTIFGIVVFGSYLADVHGAQQLAGEAARSSVAGLTETERGSIASTASFLIGSRLAFNVSLPNGVLGSMLGTTLSLSVMDYDAPLGARIDAFAFLSALATRVNLTGMTYDKHENFTSSIAGSLLGDLNISVPGLCLAIPGAGRLVTSISWATSSIDQLLAATLAILGVGIGQADV